MEKAEQSPEQSLNPENPMAQHGSQSTLTIDLNEKSAEDHRKYTPDHARHAAPRSNSHGVDVENAQAEFAELRREMTASSQLSQKMSRTQSGKSKSKKVTDLEKAATADDPEDEGQFDLEGYLRGNKQLEEEAGIKNKHIGVIWDHLTVSGTGGVKNYVKTFPDAFVDFFNVPATIFHLFGWGKKGREVDILRDLHGVVKPGEMVLVLGRPGSGCTTFLKVISNQRYGYTKIDGEVMYGPFDHKTFSQRYRGEAVYNEEDE